MYVLCILLCYIGYETLIVEIQEKNKQEMLIMIWSGRFEGLKNKDHIILHISYYFCTRWLMLSLEAERQLQNKNHDCR